MALQFNIDKKNNDNNNDTIIGKNCDNKKKLKKLRCSFEGCRKKLSLLDLECKCKNKYCLIHGLIHQAT